MEDPVKEFSYDLDTNCLRVTGYSVEEVEALLALYREHLRLQLEAVRPEPRS